MILVIGEALVDLVIAPDGGVDAALGGAPYNTARAASRLGADVEFVGGLSDDRFGQLLRQRLVDDGVDARFAVATSEPTTLAAAEIDDTGAADYRFYFHGTSAPLVELADAERAVGALGAGDIVFTGGLGLVLEPMAQSIVGALSGLADAALLVVDINCREAVIPNREAYLQRVRAVAARADVVKVSDEDLTYLTPDLDTADAAQRLLEQGPRAVIVTAGAAHTTVVTADDTPVVEVPPLAGEVVDTIGAGDTFAAGMLAWWHAAGVGRRELTVEQLVAGVRLGHAAAGVVVTRRGADPPTRAELDIEWP